LKIFESPAIKIWHIQDKKPEDSDKREGMHLP